jgi:hypothetical protein
MSRAAATWQHVSRSVLQTRESACDAWLDAVHGMSGGLRSLHIGGEGGLRVGPAGKELGHALVDPLVEARDVLQRSKASEDKKTKGCSKCRAK